ncbi:MAG: ABC transporter permease subunit [Pseudomonadota bacterium]
MDKPLPAPIVTVISMVGLGLGWVLLAWAKADPTVLPQPWEVFAIALGEARSGELWLHLSATLARVAAAFVVAMAVGTALGLWLGRSEGANRWADPWVIVFLNLPALMIIVLCYLWIGLTEVAAITAVAINKTAMVLVTVREGVRALDRPLDEMAQVYRLSRWERLRHVVVPQLAPHLSTAARNGVAVIWKIVLVVEFLGRSNGIGFQIHLYFQLFETGYVLAYALTFVGVMLAVEYALLQPAEARAARWRRAAA